MNKARPAMGVALKAKIAVEAFGSRGDLAVRYHVDHNRFKVGRSGGASGRAGV